MKKSALVVILIAAIVGIAGFYYYQNFFSKGDLRLEILGQEEVELLDEVKYIVKYKNNGNTELEEPELIFEFPQYSILENGGNGRVTKNSEELGGSIYPGEERTITFLKKVVRKIYSAMKITEKRIFEKYPTISPILPDEITFIYAEELAKKYPDKSPKQREDIATKKYGAVFVIGIGGTLSDGKPHDGRAPDYDDWSTINEEGYAGLNGDILVWFPLLDRAFEISSMGIRVDKDALEKQLEIQGKSERKELLWHKRLLSGDLPLSIGGGIGQSRLCMFFLRKAHIGEVQSSIWPDKMKQICSEKGIFLL
ncbi:MAG: hypothetical protein KKF44_01500 [Nanoarchaeota archaeon]|nr:hypothetical protein [Nanoarchaeota archaeon]